MEGVVAYECVIWVHFIITQTDFACTQLGVWNLFAKAQTWDLLLLFFISVLAVYPHHHDIIIWHFHRFLILLNIFFHVKHQFIHVFRVLFDAVHQVNHGYKLFLQVCPFILYELRLRLTIVKNFVLFIFLHYFEFLVGLFVVRNMVLLLLFMTHFAPIHHVEFQLFIIEVVYQDRQYLSIDVLLLMDLLGLVNEWWELLVVEILLNLLLLVCIQLLICVI